MKRRFVCLACGQQTMFDPARCAWHLVICPDGAGGTQRRLSSVVRCAGCGREHRVPVGAAPLAATAVGGGRDTR